MVRGQRANSGQDAEVSSLLFFEGHPGILMTTESQDLGLTSHLGYSILSLDKRFINASHVWKDVKRVLLFQMNVISSSIIY